VLLDEEPAGSVSVTSAWLMVDLAVPDVPSRRPARWVAGTGLAHQVGLIRSLSADGVTHHRYAAR